MKKMSEKDVGCKLKEVKVRVLNEGIWGELFLF